MAAVAGGRLQEPMAGTLPDYRVERLPDDVVPMIRPDADATAEGLLFSNLTSDQVSRLDLFEGAFGYQRTSRDINTSKGLMKAQVYLPPRDARHGEGPWDLNEWVKSYLPQMLSAVEELFSQDPLPSKSNLRRMWPVIEKRAWARHRAAQEIRPDTIRHQPSDDDITVHAKSPPLGSFFRLQGVEVDHRRFDGTRSARFQREVFLGVDAALVLPYDPETDRIMLIEQVRFGPFMRGDKNPWQLEPIAGMTDARETPEQAARRETLEEAGLNVDRLDHMFSMYPSPGSSTDHFVCYCAPCSLGDADAYQGGLEEENEDLRIHLVSFTDALALVESGEITAGPMIAMIYWLAANRDRYRSLA